MLKTFLDRWSAWLVVAILIISGVAMLTLAKGDSLTMDELAHIPSGYSYVRYLDHRLNPEHPPLLKAMAGIPLLFLDLKFPTDSPNWTEEINSQWDMGRKFIFESDNNSDLLIFLARLGPILFTLLTALFVYFWGRRLAGRAWAILPAALVALSPNFLSHGHYVTTDVAAAGGIAFATFFFLRFLDKPDWKSALWAGLAFGLAQAAKFSAVLLIPYFFILLVFRAFAETASDGSPGSIRRNLVPGARFWQTIVIMAVGLMLVVYPIYTVFTWQEPTHKQAADTESILRSFADGPTPPGELCKPLRCLAELDIAMSKSRLTQPLSKYTLGVLMVIQRSSGGNTNYFLGQVSAAGSHWYFPVVYLLKEPLPVLVLVLFALFFACLRMFRRGKPDEYGMLRRVLIWIRVNFTEFALLFFVLFYWAYSVKSPLNIGFRHLFPVLPFIYLLLSRAWQKTLQSDSLRAWLKYPFGILFFWFVLEAALAYPNFLSYFNQTGGGVENGYRYVTDSNYDWGQDVLRLKALIDSRNNDDDRDNDIPKIAIDYFGGAHTPYYFGDKAVPWWSSKGDQREQGIHWLAVSVNSLESAIQKTAPGFERKPEDEYRWLTSERPLTDSGLGAIPQWDLRAGTSIFLYRLP